MPSYVDLVANAFSEARAWKFSTFVLAAALAVTSVALVYVTSHHPTYLVPYNFATAKGPVKVAAGSVSNQNPEYIGFLASADLGLILVWTPETVVMQYSRFLNRATPELYSSQQVKLLDEAAQSAKNGETQAFYPRNVRVTGDTANIDGTLVRWSGEKEVMRNTMRYEVRYKDQGGMLYVDRLSVVDR